MNQHHYNYIFNQLRQNEKYANNSDDEINDIIHQMYGMEKEAYLKPSSFESDEHIQKVIHKIFRSDDAYTKFDFQNGRPQKSTILTTRSIDMAKRYYHTIKEMTRDPEWLVKEIVGHPILRVVRLKIQVFHGSLSPTRYKKTKIIPNKFKMK